VRDSSTKEFRFSSGDRKARECRSSQPASESAGENSTRLILTRRHTWKMKKRGKKVHNDTKEQICKEKKNKFVEKREEK